jgi:hypothetical protein
MFLAPTFQVFLSLPETKPCLHKCCLEMSKPANQSNVLFCLSIHVAGHQFLLDLILSEIIFSDSAIEIVQ